MWQRMEDDFLDTLPHRWHSKLEPIYGSRGARQVVSLLDEKLLQLKCFSYVISASYYVLAKATRAASECTDHACPGDLINVLPCKVERVRARYLRFLIISEPWRHN